ncbi:MAG TPA: hypothetical protein ENN54_03350 [Thermoplasmatales archaeon]|nr:hypothetical protein [Candidatus Thermoplasmatota archaeon]MDD5778600.1 hypothetical protein [Candidatus Thermoplasmatota archaeon]HDS59311.1 hypothetical protein [Thermoplasmatales archaeon]
MPGRSRRRLLLLLLAAFLVLAAASVLLVFHGYLLSGLMVLLASLGLLAVLVAVLLLPSLRFVFSR